MMKLIEVLESIIGEESETVSFPDDNFNAVFDDTQKRIIFSPIRPGASSTKVRTFVNLLKQNYNIQSVAPKANNSFDIKVDPTEDFGLVKDFILKQAEQSD